MISGDRSSTAYDARAPFAAPAFPRRPLRARDRLRQPAALRAVDRARAGNAVLPLGTVADVRDTVRRDRQRDRLPSVRIFRRARSAPAASAGTDGACRRRRRHDVLRDGNPADVPAAARCEHRRLPVEHGGRRCRRRARDRLRALGGGEANDSIAARALVPAGADGRSGSCAARDLARSPGEPRHSAVRDDVRRPGSARRRRARVAVRQ